MKYIQNEANKNKDFKSSTSIILVLMVFFTLGKALSYGQIIPGVDFYQFWVVGQAIVRSDVNNIYLEADRRKIGLEFFQKSQKNVSSNRQLMAAKRRKVLETYSTPFLYAVFYFFATGNYEIDFQAYHIFSLASMLFAIVGLCRLLRYSLIGTMAMIVIFMEWFEPFLSDLRVANVNMVQLGLLALFLWFQSKHEWRAHNFIGGLVLGFSIMFKPNIVFVLGMLVISWVINRRYRKLVFEFAGILIASVGALVYSSIFFDSVRCWTDWLAALQNMPNDILNVNKGNFSPARLIWDWTGIKTSIYLSILFVIVSTTFVWISRRSTGKIAGEITGNERDQERAFFEDALMVATGCLIYLLSAPLVWSHYFVLIIPMALFALRPLDTTQPVMLGETLTRRILPATAIIGLAANPIVNLFNIDNVRYVAFIVCISTLILFGLALWELLDLRIRLQQEDEKE